MKVERHTISTVKSTSSIQHYLRHLIRIHLFPDMHRFRYRQQQFRNWCNDLTIFLIEINQTPILLIFDMVMAVSGKPSARLTFNLSDWYASIFHMSPRKSRNLQLNKTDIPSRFKQSQ